MTWALQRGAPAIIAEIKRASPSKGLLRASAAPAVLAKLYEDNGASAISVLTESEHFMGSLEDMADVRAASALPILRKDFITDEYQLLEARAFGADAVLLIATVLERGRLHALQQVAAALTLESLVEVYHMQDLDRVDWDLATMVGANNRDLRTFRVDPMRAARILQHVPQPVVRVAESGLRLAGQLSWLHEAGVDAFLIGEHFMRAADPGAALKGMLTHLEAYAA